MLPLPVSFKKKKGNTGKRNKWWKKGGVGGMGLVKEA